MDDALLAVAVVSGWFTIAGGAFLALRWMAAGSGQAAGPDDAQLGPTERSSLALRARRQGRATTFSVAHVGIHAMVALFAVVLLTIEAVAGTAERGGALGVAVVALGVVVALGLGLFVRWRRALAQDEVSDEQIPERRLPASVATVHGLGAAVTFLAAAGALIAHLV